MTAVLYISTGIALYSAVLSLQRLARAPAERASVQILHAVLALSVAGFACTSAWLPAVAPAYAMLLGKAVVAWGLMNWLVLVWLLTLVFRPQRRAVALGLSVLWAGLSLLNLALPAGLVYAEFMPQPYRGSELFARLGQAWLLTHAVLVASWGYALWCVGTARTPYPRAGWWVALLLLGGATGIDLLITAGLLSPAFLAPVVWALLLVLVGGGLREISSTGAAAGQILDQVPDQAPAEADAPPPDVHAMALSVRTHRGPLALPGGQPGTALHLHWHLDEAGQYPLAPMQLRAFHAPAQIHPETAQEIPLPPAANRGATVETDAGTPAPRPMENALTAIVQFARIAQRRIERGKLDAGKLATLFRAIQQKARHAQDALPDTLPDTLPDALLEKTGSREIPMLIARVLAQAAARLQAEGIRVVQRIAEDLPASRVDDAVVEQALRELLHQAIEATRAADRAARKPIVLIARPTRAGGVELSITDGGADVSLADIREAFAALLGDGNSVEHAPLIATAEQIGVHGGRLWCAPNPAGGSIRFLRLPGGARQPAPGTPR